MTTNTEQESVEQSWIQTHETNHGRGPNESFFCGTNKFFGVWPDGGVTVGAGDVKRHPEQALALAEYINEALGVKSQAATIATLQKRNAELEEEQAKHPIWFMWRPSGRIPVIKGPFMKVEQALKFASEIYEINKVDRVSVLNGWTPNKLGGDSIENFMFEFGDRRTTAFKQFYSDDAKAARAALNTKDA